MLTMNAKEVERRWFELLELVSQGEIIQITRGRRVVAKLVASTSDGLTVSQAIRRMEKFQKDGPTIGPDLTIRQLIDEGRP